MFAPSTDSEARAQVAALIAACPLGDSDADCPFAGLRDLKGDEASLYAMAEDEDECHKLCRHHATCFAQRCGDR
ncbi:MAG: hypothetical protein PF961_20365 [Planctomycetota bacterium]|jgi:hypothetical protein|nr:hypothetical protein [Planctomycetota bacterium]